MNKYLWLAKHLIWNGPAKTGKTYWIKVSESDALILKKEYKVVDSKPIPNGALDVIEMLNNYFVLDTR